MSQSVAVVVPSSNRDRWLIWLSLASLYIVWGSTYLGIRIAVQTIPPFALNTTRFVLAGALLYMFLRARGAANPTPIQLRNASIVGLFLIVGGNGLVTLAEHLGAPSGIVATVVATMPLWAGLWSSLWGNRPRKLEWIGMGVGLIGVALLTLEGSLRANPGAFVVFLAPVCWSFGSILSRHLEMPEGLMASSVEMFVGGLIALPISLLLHEPWRVPSLESALAFAYLVSFGSLIAFNAYIYLLTKVRPALATSYAYVNPVVAVILGALLAGEHFGISALVALPVILTGVGLVMYAQNRARA